MPSTRSVVLSLCLGLLHAGVLLAVALELGYPVGPVEYSIVGLAWRYGGLVVVAALPVWLALRYRIVGPLAAVILTTGYVLGLELTPPGPTFQDAAELERLAEPTGIIVVENGLYIVRYMGNATVWTVGFLFVGLLEYTVRTTWDWLPPLPSQQSWLSSPTSRRQAAVVAASGGLLHAVVMVWFAIRLGLTVSGDLWWVVNAVGMWVLAAVPLYLLLRHHLVAPAALLTGFVLLDVQAAFTASVDDPHALYFGLWFVYLGIFLVVAGIEYGLRRAGGLRD